ncbi:Repetin [Streptomyces sp. NPDC006798]|uniref:Repetin n=1 Tax=Streptomyces sp. NPDC006798 TaxID=3155462 RepID=UPI0033C78406
MLRPPRHHHPDVPWEGPPDPQGPRAARQVRAVLVAVGAIGTVLLTLGAGTPGAASASASAQAEPQTQTSASASASASATGTDRPRDAAALTGEARLFRTAGDRITFSFDARLAARDGDDPLKARGTFRRSHHACDGTGGGFAEAKVGRLVTGGRAAVVTGTVTRTDIERIARGTNLRVGITVHDDGRRDRLGHSWASTGDPVGMGSVPECAGPAPFEKVLAGSGDYRVPPWNPPL